MMLAAPMSPSSERLGRLPEILTACCALGALLAVEWYLTLVIPGTSYSQSDGKLYQTLVVSAFRFGGIFNLTNLNPVQGYGSLMLPINVWVNPAYWPFAVQDMQLATDISATLAVGCLAVGCYIMARCFEVPVLPSIIAAQLVIVLLPPLVRVTGTFYQMLWLDPGIATVYAIPMVALGIFARLDTGYADKFLGKALVRGNSVFSSSIFSNPATKNFLLVTGGVFAWLLYGIFSDPFWMAISGIALVGAFAVVMLSEFRTRAIVRRFLVLGCCLALLLASGALVYFYTLSQYTARVWWGDVLGYQPQQYPFLASITRIYPATLQHYYLPCAAGWLLGLMFARGRARVLVCATLGSFVLYAAEAAIYLRSSHWSMLPLPIYIEGAAMPLFTVGAFIGYWSALNTLANAVQNAWKKAARNLPQRLVESPRPWWPPSSLLASCRPVVAGVAALVVGLVVPASAAVLGVSIGTSPMFVPFPNEPELLHYFRDSIGLRVGGDYRGMVWLSTNDTTTFALWLNGVPTALEYSQTFSPVVLYLYSAVFRLPVEPGYTNGINPTSGPDGSYDVFLKTLQALGARYLVYTKHFPAADQKQFPVLIFPRRPPILEGGSASPEPPGDYIVYQLPEANIGDYSPTRIVVARTGAEIAAIIRDPNFDFKDQAILSSDLSMPLVPASATKLSIIRNGLHFKAHSDGTSLVILPQQFSKCLSARDPGVRLVRADLLMTGVIFSGDIDTDISFDYGIFSPWCRLTDMSDTKSLDLKIDAAAH
jgi:hypothetical protein